MNVDEVVCRACGSTPDRKMVRGTSQYKAVKKFLGSRWGAGLQEVDELFTIMNGEYMLGCLSMTKINDHYGYLGHVKTLRWIRRSGIGKDLVGEGLAWAKEQGMKAVFLDTTTDESANFFSSIGAREGKPESLYRIIQKGVHRDFLHSKPHEFKSENCRAWRFQL